MDVFKRIFLKKYRFDGFDKNEPVRKLYHFIQCILRFSVHTDYFPFSSVITKDQILMTTNIEKLIFTTPRKNALIKLFLLLFFKTKHYKMK